MRSSRRCRCKAAEAIDAVVEPVVDADVIGNKRVHRVLLARELRV